MIQSVKKSLADLTGIPYVDALVKGYAFFRGDDQGARELATQAVEFFPQAYADRLDDLLSDTGKQVADAFEHDNAGATTRAFRKATNLQQSPVGAYGWYRLGQNGKLYVIAKTEHYHASVGHAFPGFALLNNARQLGIPSATHNNTRGYITRLVERELIRTANGIVRGDNAALGAVVDSTDDHILNRSINLESGSLATEAAIKMVLSRFYRLMPEFPDPEYHGRIPVFFVMGDHAGGLGGNYHGTTMFTQYLRGMWDTYAQRAQQADLFRIVPVKMNDINDFKEKLQQYNKPPYKTALFSHELVLMNYGCYKLDENYLQQAYALCDQTDTPKLCDEIQSCIWCDGMYLFRLYGLKPDFVSVGKGFPGGEYAASRILTTRKMDNLNQFGALITNGQNELASLAYLINMEFAQHNAAHIREIGDYYQNAVHDRLKGFAAFKSVEGYGLLLGIHFNDLELTNQFCAQLSARGFDIGAQTYKADCPPAAITKLPIIASAKLVDTFVSHMVDVLKSL